MGDHPPCHEQGVIKSKWWWSVELTIVGRKNEEGSKLKFHSGTQTLRSFDLSHI